MRQFLDELDCVGQPPFGDELGQMLTDLDGADVTAIDPDADQQRPLVPLGMGNADRGGLQYAGTTNRSIF